MTLFIHDKKTLHSGYALLSTLHRSELRIWGVNVAKTMTGERRKAQWRAVTLGRDLWQVLKRRVTSVLGKKG